MLYIPPVREERVHRDIACLGSISFFHHFQGCQLAKPFWHHTLSNQAFNKSQGILPAMMTSQKPEGPVIHQHPGNHSCDCLPNALCQQYFQSTCQKGMASSLANSCVNQEVTRQKQIQRKTSPHQSISVGCCILFSKDCLLSWGLVPLTALLRLPITYDKSTLFSKSSYMIVETQQLWVLIQIQTFKLTIGLVLASEHFSNEY